MSQSAEHANIGPPRLWHPAWLRGGVNRPHPLKASQCSEALLEREPAGPREVAPRPRRFATAHRYPDPSLPPCARSSPHGSVWTLTLMIPVPEAPRRAQQILKTFASVNIDGDARTVICAWRSLRHTRSSSVLWVLTVCGYRVPTVSRPGRHGGSHHRCLIWSAPPATTGPAVTESQIRAFLAKVPFIPW